jgi:hypothetical protein
VHPIVRRRPAEEVQDAAADAENKVAEVVALVMLPIVDP